MRQHVNYAWGKKAGPRNALSKPGKKSVYEIVTNRIIEALEEGVVPWRRPWQERSAQTCNALSHRPYHGINLFLLSLSRFSDHRWLTYRQAEELGGSVRAGEKSSIAIFWKRWEPKDDEEQNGKPHHDHAPILRYYHLFNVGQCDGLSLPDLESEERPHHQRIEAAEALARSMPDPPKLHEGEKLACYYPLLDTIQVPALDTFETPDAYYATLFHELGHATGHEKRLNRPGVTLSPRFGSSDYSREELVAELTSAFCSASIGLDNSIIENSASYIHGWITTLRADSRAIVVASAHAQRAADYLLGLSPSDAGSHPGSSHSPAEETS